VPEFILQPLVENAIRHGIAKRAEAGLIEITACESDSEVVLSIQDNGPGYHPMSDAGVGLANTRARLATLFGETGRLEVVNVRVRRRLEMFSYLLSQSKILAQQPYRWRE